MCSLPDTVGLSKSKIMWHVAGMGGGGGKKCMQNFRGKREGRGQLGSTGRKMGDNIKVGVREIVWGI